MRSGSSGLAASRSWGQRLHSSRPGAASSLRSLQKMDVKLDAQSCEQLLKKQRYNPDIIPALEAYVEAQCAENTYDLDCNLAVLKLYQFHPERNNVMIVAKILAKALMKLPDTDYLLCSYLIPERVVPPPPQIAAANQPED